MPVQAIVDCVTQYFPCLEALSLKDKVEAINKIREALAEYSPFRDEPVDCVRWVHKDGVGANDYNPNKVAPPEMKLLEHSIISDGYTQPIVTWDDDTKEGLTVIDGFHRHRVGKESEIVANRIRGYLPVVVINNERTGRNDRIASTIRHNRARGKHQIDAMSDIVIELKRRNWTTPRICKELGMEEDEVLRLCQITGLSEMFTDADFSQSWDAVGEIDESDFEELTSDEVDPEDGNRNPNTNDPERVFHTYDKWECFKAGFYENGKPGLKKADAEERYASFLSDDERFRQALQRVITEWPNSCEHYLTNKAMNRIAWLGQASACIAEGLPSVYRSGFFLMSEDEQERANQTAFEYLNRWLTQTGRETVTFEEAYDGRQSDIY